MNVYLLLVIFICSVASCSPSHKTAEDRAREQEQVRLPDSLNNLQQWGVDFIATGNNPASWKLSVDFDKGIDFTGANNYSLSVQVVKKDSASTGSTAYKGISSAGKIQVIIYDVPCEFQSGIKGKKVDVTVNNTRYTGCGKYLYNSKINDHWVLEKINNKQQEASVFPRGLPHLVLDIKNGKLSGSDGCNRLTGSFEVRGSRISLGPFANTKMACAGNPAEKIFSRWLSNNLVDYLIKNDKLVLYLGDDSSLTFARKG